MSILNSIKDRDLSSEASWKIDVFAREVEQEYLNRGCSRDFLRDALRLQPILATHFVKHILEHFDQPHRKYLTGKRNPYRNAADAGIKDYFHFGPLGKKFFYKQDGKLNKDLEASLHSWRHKSYDEKLYEIERRYPAYTRAMLEKLCLKE